MSPAADLPLTAMERFLLADDARDYPMSFFVQADFRGELFPPDLHAALAEATARHPLLTARLTDGPRGPAWTFPESAPPEANWGAAEQPLGARADEWIDLRREPGLRTWVRQENGRSTVTLQFHHVCCDGVGALQFLGDLIVLYARRRGDDSLVPLLRPLPPDALATRERVSALRPYARRRWAMAGRSLTRAARHFVWERPTWLHAPAGTTAEAAMAPSPGLLQRRIGAEDYRRLRREARRHGASVNTLLLAALFQTLARWNQEHGAGRPGKWLRVLMPADMRGQAEARLSACNAVSYVFLNRRGTACGDWPRLLAGLQQETTIRQRREVAASFFNTVALSQRFGLVRRMLSSGPCLTTAILTNVGELRRRFGAAVNSQRGLVRAGDLELLGAVGTAPVRPGTRAAFGVNTYAGELALTLRVDSRWLSVADGQQLLQQFVDCLEEHAADAPAPPAARGGPPSLAPESSHVAPVSG